LKAFLFWNYEGEPDFDSQSSSLPLPISSSSSILYPKLAGYICCGIAVLFFGSYMLPVKRIYSGNGIFYQWSMCLGIWCAGLSVFAYRGFPKFEPFAMLGGVFWCVGNAMSVPIVNLVGLALGMSIWCVANCATGWASSFFGTLGIDPQYSTKDDVKLPLNVTGVALAVCSIILFSLVQSDTGDKDDSKKSTSINAEESYDLLLTDPLKSSFSISDGLARKKSAEEEEQRIRREKEEDGFAKCSAKLSPGVRKLLGILLAAVSGFCYGVNFNPSTHLMEDKDHDHSRDPLDYVFPHFTGILATSTLIMMIYSIGAGNKPTVYPRIVFPGFIAGLMWAVAQISWFIANASLKMAIAFPIITSGPAIIASFWGIVVFHEIRGAKQILLMVFAFCITISGVVLIALSDKN